MSSPDRVIPGRVSPAVVDGDLLRADGTRSRTLSPDLRDIIPRMRAGDTEALVVLMKFTIPTVVGVLKNRFGEDELESVKVKRILTATLSTIFTHVIEDYDPTLSVPESLPPHKIRSFVAKKYNAYVRKSTFNNCVDYLRKESRASQVTTLITPNYSVENSVDPTVAFLNTPEGEVLLNDGQKMVVDLKLQGYSDDDINGVVGIGKGAVKARLTRVRRRIEKALLFPNGFRPIAEFVSSEDELFQLYAACRTGKILAPHVLGNWYTHRKWVKEYIKNHIDPPAPEYVLVSSFAGSDTRNYEYISNNLSHPRLRVIVRDGRLYAHPDDMEEVLAAKNAQKKERKERNTGGPIYP